jgi:O-antigen ligase
MKFIAQPLEILFAAVFLLIIQGVFWPPISYLSTKAAPLDASDPISATAHWLLIGFLVAVVAAHWPAMRDAVRSAWLLLLLVGLAYLSAFWSDAPELVLRRATTLAGTTLFAIYLAARFELARLVAMLVLLNAAAAIGSFVVIAIAPQLGMSGNVDYPNAWRGIYTAKNILGSMCGFGVIIAVYALWRGYGSRLIAAALVPANLLLLYLSQSATPLIVLLVAAYVATAASAFRIRGSAGFVTGFVLLLIGLLGVGLLAVGWTEVLAMLGRSPTLTGRSEIWGTIIDYIGRRPWLGYGYGAFWRQDAVEARTIWGIFSWTVPHAHNAWLEIGLGLGIVGMAGITLLWLAAFTRAIRVLRLPRAQHAVFCLALFAAILVVNMTEYEFLRADTFLWVLFAIAFVYLGREAAAHRAARAAVAPALPRRPVAPLAYPGPRTAP